MLGTDSFFAWHLPPGLVRHAVGVAGQPVLPGPVVPAPVVLAGQPVLPGPVVPAPVGGVQAFPRVEPDQVVDGPDGARPVRVVKRVRFVDDTNGTELFTSPQWIIISNRAWFTTCRHWGLAKLCQS